MNTRNIGNNVVPGNIGNKIHTDEAVDLNKINLKGVVQVVVQDNGIGIAPENLAHILETIN